MMMRTRVLMDARRLTCLKPLDKTSKIGIESTLFNEPGHELVIPEKDLKYSFLNGFILRDYLCEQLVPQILDAVYATRDNR